MNLHRIKGKIRPEEALVILAFFLLLAFRVSVGAGVITFGSLASRLVSLSNMLIEVTIYIFCIVPFFIVWVRGMMKNAKSEEVNFQSTYRTFYVGLKNIANFLRIYLPFVLIVVIYDDFTNRNSEGMDLTRVLVKKDFTPLLIRADQILFGTQVSYWTEGYTTQKITDVMTFAYLLHFLFPFLLATYFYLRGKTQYLRELILAAVIVSWIGYVGYLTVPSMSPIYVLSYDIDLDGGPMTKFVLDEIAKTRSETRDCCLFPSLHVAVSSVTLIIAFNRDRKVFYLLLPWILLTWASTLYLRRHFVVDVIAGWATALVGIYLTPKVERWWYGGGSDYVV